MDVKEKLVELIANAKRSMWGKNGLSCELARNMYLAENLIAHGVTVQEWISVEDRLPEESSRCLCYWKGNICRCKYWRHHKQFEFNGRVMKVTHWMPLPEPPKGE